jgi:hypothetical protein
LETEPVGEFVRTDTPSLASERIVQPPAETPEGVVAEVEPPEEPLLFGVVLDADTEEPIEGAGVVMNGFARHRATSDAQGRFELECEGGELFEFSIEKPGYLTDIFGIRLELRPRKGDAYVFPLQPSGRIEGTVSFRDGEPVTSGRVLVMNGCGPLVPSPKPLEAALARDPWSGTISGAIYGFRPPNFHLGLAPSASIDEDGDFLLECMPGSCFGGPDSIRLVVDSDEAIRTSSELFSISPGRTKTMNIQVERASHIEGILHFPPGADSSRMGLWFCWHESHMDQLGGEGSGRSDVDRLVRVDPNGVFDSGPLWPTKRLKILAVVRLSGLPRRSSALVYDWELELPEDSVLHIELTPGGAIQDLTE